MLLNEKTICRRLVVDDSACVEIESKHRVLPQDMEKIHRYLADKKKTQSKKMTLFFDQYLDTPDYRIYKSGASLRLRYKKRAQKVYLQYKGPGFHQQGLLYRSEFVSKPLTNVVLEESRHDSVRFNTKNLQRILMDQLPDAMRKAIAQHLDSTILSKITLAPLICVYQKEKFVVQRGNCFLEPSLDQMFVFQTIKNQIHPLSTFCEYENEVKSPTDSLRDKIEKIPALLSFDAKLVGRFKLPLEKQDKYHRLLSSLKLKA